MSPTLQSLGIDQLSREQRIVLVQEIWESIVAESAPPMLTETQRRELQRRIAEDDADPDKTVSWEQVKAQTLSRIRK
jgi:putative addiction module component (TIGR02574 family)